MVHIYEQDAEVWPLYRIERWPQNKGFLMYYYGVAVRGVPPYYHL